MTQETSVFDKAWRTTKVYAAQSPRRVNRAEGVPPCANSTRLTSASYGPAMASLTEPTPQSPSFGIGASGTAPPPRSE
jgi:hypothetical protein